MAKPTEQQIGRVIAILDGSYTVATVAQLVADEAERARLETLEEAAHATEEAHSVLMAPSKLSCDYLARRIRALAKPREDSNG